MESIADKRLVDNLGENLDFLATTVLDSSISQRPSNEP